MLHACPSSPCPICLGLTMPVYEPRSIMVDPNPSPLLALERKLDAMFIIILRRLTNMSATLDDVLNAIQTNADAIGTDLGTLAGEISLLMQRLGTEVVSQAHLDQGAAIAAKLAATSQTLKGLVTQAAPPSAS